jgi:citrate synthase
MKRQNDAWISADEAVKLMQVTRQTLYAYVSRGFIRSEATTGTSRARRYSREDVDRLRRRAEERREPDKVAAHAMQWGLPVLESSITLIADGSLYYRGYDAVALARTRSVEDVASLIWTGNFGFGFPAIARRAGRVRPPVSGLTFIARAQSELAAASLQDPLAFDVRREGVASSGWRIMNRIAGVLASSTSGNPAIDRMLARAWKLKQADSDLLRAALILSADHELNVSAFTARCVASSGSNPYAVVIAGLAALEGIRHGGATIRVETMVGSLLHESRVRSTLAERLRRGERIDGFGHPLYGNGDPRAAALLAMLRERYPKSRKRDFISKLAETGASLTREQPNLDFALAALSCVLELPQGSGITLFALGRTIGWIGHAIEQYELGQMIRPRAKYVGVAPIPPTASLP